MGTKVNCAILFVYYLLVCSNGVEGDKWNLSKEEHLEIQKELDLLTRPANKTIVTGLGDIYDCVDFYKQPAFDNAIDFQVPRSFPKTASEHKRFSKQVNIGFKGEGCPLGTVPIRRATKDDLIRERLATKVQTLSNGAGPFVAAVRTPDGKYTGGVASFSIYNPKVSVGQYSAARLKVRIGTDSIEAGWRVDQPLYGANHTRFYIRTDVGQTHCFNMLCPGFVLYNGPVDYVIYDVSKPGQDPWEVKVSIAKDGFGNLVLQAGSKDLVIGHWPSSLFANRPVTSIEYGGEINGPSGSSAPPMGSGEHAVDQLINHSASFTYITQYNEAGQPVDDANNLRTIETNKDQYNVLNAGYKDDDFKISMFYGGPGGFTI